MTLLCTDKHIRQPFATSLFRRSPPIIMAGFCFPPPLGDLMTDFRDFRFAMFVVFSFLPIRCETASVVHTEFRFLGLNPISVSF